MGHDDHYLYLGRLLYFKKSKVRSYGEKIKFKKRPKEKGLKKLALDFSFFGRRNN